ncbi:MAG: Gfo/Idh/MocA family oxidoreductase [Armatimonadetes bacterium]|nr:Gfo/Idh/MocA family oxidoreductase [Armatimonadota bacterium]
MAGKLRVGFVGTGGIATGAHLPGYQALDAVEVVAAADVSPDSLKRFSEKAGVPEQNCFADYREMLDKVDLDIVTVCTPNSWHYQPTVDAFAKGCHVLVEKPVGISADQCRGMIEAGKKAGKLFMVGQTLRFTRGAAQMKQWVDKKELGDIYFGRAQYLRVRGVPGRLGFVSRELSEGGPIYDIGVHVLDLTLWLMGFPEPVSVSAGVYNKLASKKSKLMPFAPEQYTVPEDAAFALIRFETGATVILECSWALNLVAGAHNVVLCGDKGGCQLEPTAMVRERDGVLEHVTNDIFQYPDRAGHVEEIRQFVDAILRKKPSPVPGEQALITQRILDAIYKSGEKGREVEV